MPDITRIRTAVVGLVRFAAAEEELLLAGRDPSTEEPGTADRWAARPMVAHNAEFKHQQVVRLTAVAAGQTPPEFAEVDHAAVEVYRRYAELDHEAVRRASRQAADDLVDGVLGLSEADLTDPARHPWLRGRQLWLQVIVRGFWHPTGHLGDYHVAHGEPQRALDLHHRAVATADHLGAPDPARGMARYTLACAQAGTGPLDDAVWTLRQAVALNPDLRANIARDRDLSGLRTAGRLDEFA